MVSRLLEEYFEVEEGFEAEYEEELYIPEKVELKPARNTGVCILLSVSYSGEAKKALLKLYDVEKRIMHFWYDDSGHKPYCLTDMNIEDLKRSKVVSHPGFLGFERVKKFDVLKEREVELTKIIASDPLAIGGRRGAIRDLLPKAWEADIKYHNCYIFDRQLVPGMFYKVENGKLVKVDVEPSGEESEEVLKLFEDQVAIKELAKEWLPLFLAPIPDIRRAAIDIEVYSPDPDKLPNPKEALYPIIAFSLVDSDGRKLVFLLRRENVESSQPDEFPQDCEVRFFYDEYKMLEEIFKLLCEYPVILTFNGDNFDLNYILHRALKLGFSRDKVPISMTAGENPAALLASSVHVDLYKFFHNKSIQGYAFSNKYRDVTLDAVAEALLSVRKIQLKDSVSQLSYAQLASYCLRDAELVMQFTKFNDNLVMKLVILFMRIAKMSMEDVTRQGISNWIRNMLYFEHRKRNYLIPRKDEIIAVKGQAVTEARIKGKKYMGAIVLKPPAGVYFNVAVLDFTSLYPSIVKTRNLSYEVINCNHPECKSNTIPSTPHWVCVKKQGLTSILIGMLRDIRALWFKPMSRKVQDPAKRSLYEVVEKSLKVILNASYGVMGSSNFSLYCPPVAESTTAIGRYIITKTIEKAQSLGLKVLYGDTDSIFIYEPEELRIKELMRWAEEELKVDLDYDKHYKFVAFSGLKKNYVGVLVNGEVDIKGLVGKKRNTPPFLKEAFLNFVSLLSKVDTPEAFERSKTLIRNLARRVYDRLKERRYSLDELAFTVMLSKHPSEYAVSSQHVKAAKLLMAYKKNVDSGSIIRFVKVKGEPGVKPIQLARIDEIDVDKYVEHMRTTFEQVLTALGLDFDEILGVKSITSFFNK
ncbi:DNA-directed DNA polymerase I [Candidatus Nezhaarchaeota archaeon WYZ-LMO8]|nr:MAG: DNA-directed DNA polymerase I [Candidatus Nezhaarchaeota archaeon WYZ-LMO8]TDA37260.1 MAG: DNA-directed DNA polymerase I [Candidatus Nezhaarchaeota archaeon WYZ-LMO7]